MDIESMTNKIKSVNINHASMHPSEEMHLARLFFVEIMTNGWYGMDEVEKVLNNLSYEEDIKETIEGIADTICCLRDQAQTIGRNPNGYKELMHKILS